MHLSRFLREQQEAILAEWEAFGRSVAPEEGRLDTAALRSAAAGILDLIAEDMDTARSRGHDIRRSRGEFDGVPSSLDESARQHAAVRLNEAFSLHELTTEYRALRASVTRLWREASGTTGLEELDELTRFDEAIDESLTRAIVWYDARLGQAEHDTRQSEQRYRSLCELSPDAILVHDGARWVYANQAAATLIGFSSPREMLGRPVVEFLLPEYRDAGRERMRQVLEGQSVPPVEYKLQRHGGRIIDVEVVAAPTSWKGATAAQVIVRDVTDRKRTEQALKDADRAKDEFLAVLGHELRNPLAPLRTALDLLEQVHERPDVLDMLRPMMERQLSHLVRLVDDLLDISRISRGRIELQRKLLDLNAPVSAAVEQVRPQIAGRGHELEIDLADEALPVDGDPERLTQVVANLLANAATYTERGGTIRLTTCMRGDRAVAIVQDTGLGIPEQHIETLFEPFSQIPEHRALTGGGGLGIGLALSRRLMSLHGGTIGAESPGMGAGSRFTIALPVRAAEEPVAPQESPETARGPVRRVLVVDDNVDAAEGLRMLLELQGHTARAVHDGAAALAEVKDFMPDVVLLDLGLPGMDGIEVAGRLRELPEGAGVALVAVTGWGQDEHRQRTTAAGFDAHLTKPIDVQQIAAVLEEARQPA